MGDNKCFLCKIELDDDLGIKINSVLGEYEFCSPHCLSCFVNNNDLTPCEICGYYAHPQDTYISVHGLICENCYEKGAYWHGTSR